MSMSQRDRILTVYRGETPDAVPFMLDLSHWFYHKHGRPWDLSQAFEVPECPLIDYHKDAGVGFYLANLGCFYEVQHGDDVRATVQKSADGLEIVWGYETPLGSIRRRRTWQTQTYSWAVPEWGIQTEGDLRILAYALAGRSYTPRWDLYQAPGCGHGPQDRLARVEQDGRRLDRAADDGKPAEVPG